MSTPITVYGDVDTRAVEQLQRCADAGDALRGALCADGHVGYSQPIGGAVAYADHISPSGVGYDIACIAAGTPVTTADGYFKPIEAVRAGEPVLAWDTAVLRPVTPCEGAIARGTRELRRVTLGLSRSLLLTDDHRVRTRLGWKRADELRSGDAVACSPFVGLPHEEGGMAPELLRLVAYCAGDGHLGVNGKTIAWYSNSASDIADLADDLARLGFAGGVSERRERGQHVLTRRSVELHARFRELGVPVGKKVYAWPERPFEWVFDLPAWQRGVFLSAFMSAEGSTPALASGTSYIAALAVKQSGVTDAPIWFVERLFGSLGFDVTVAPSGPPREDGRQSYVAQLQGGEAEILRYLREVGYNRAVAKRRAAAAMLSVAAQRQAMLPMAVGGEAFSVGQAPDHSGEVAWLPVLANEATGTSGAVFDVVTGDPAECFLAGGVVVHNCGNKASRTNLRADDLRADLSGIMDSIFERVSFGVGRRNNEPVEHEVLDRIQAANFEPQRALHETASKQLGTVGAGNHYVDLFEDEEGWVWIGVHFGSRGFGHRTASGFLALAQGLAFDGHAKEGEMDSPPVLFHVDSELGQSYIEAMNLAGEYAYAGRDTVVAKVLEILGAEETESVHNHHNFAWRENHFGTDVWVIRKGCTPAFPGQEGFVGATMGEPSVILRGTDSSAGRELLYSTVHGAGRVMSRTKAAGKLRTRAECSVRDCDTHVPWNKRHDQQCPEHPDAKWVKRRRIVQPGLIDFAAVQQELSTAGIELRGGAADEAPGAYKRLDQVLAAHGDTIEIVHRLTPLGVAMAGAETFDPYKD